MTGRILITGATGEVGSRVLDLLADDTSTPVRAMCRRPDQLDAFRARGIDAARSSWEQPDALRAAMDGCDTLFLLTPVVQDQEQIGTRAIQTAQAAGVSRVVHLSAGDARLGSPVPWAHASAAIDERLRASGLRWTTVRPVGFMNNLLEPAGAIRRGVLPQMAGSGRVAFIDPADIAQSVVQVLRHPDAHDEADHVLTGPQALTFGDVAAVMSHVLGHRVKYVRVPAPLLRLAFRASGMPAWQADGLVAQFADVVRHGKDGADAVTRTVQDLLGRPPRNLEAYLRERASELGG